MTYIRSNLGCSSLDRLLTCSRFVRSSLVALLFFIPLLSLAFLARADEGGQWIVLASMDQPRQEIGAARLGDLVYVVGGLVNFGFSRSTVEAYEIANDRWIPIAPIPAPRDHMGVAAVGGKLYVSGGYSGSFDSQDTLFIYDPATGVWSEGAPLPQARGAHWMVAFDGKLYLFGGADTLDRARDETFIYDPATDSWSQGADMPNASEHLNAVVAGDFIYVLGGRAGASFNFNQRYHPATDTWTVLTPMPTARSAMAAAALDGKIYAMGGEIPRLFAVNEVYDIATDTWDCAAPMPLPRHGVAAVALDDRILVPAGGIVQGAAPTNRVDAFIPEPVVGPEDQVRFRFAGFRGTEGEATAQISVVRQGDGQGEVTVEYATEDGSATAGLDYQSVSGVLQWDDGDTTRKTFQVPLLDDSELEGDETVRLTLANPVGAELGVPAEATLTIGDDDLGTPGALSFEAAAYPAEEGNGVATVVVRRNGGDLGAVSVDYTSEDLSATGGADYTAVSGTLAWVAGEGGAKSFTVPLIDDADPERTELMRVLLGNVTGEAGLQRDTAVVAILDDDRPAGCFEDGDALCLVGDGRFRVEAEWRDPRSGDHGLAPSLDESETTGFFWFFSPTNVELIVKMLDGRGITDAFWVFYGALSDVEYWITVTDTERDATDPSAVRIYHNEPFELASVADTAAFPEPSIGPDASSSGSDSLGATTRRGSLLAFPAAGEGGSGPTEPCVPDAETLCLGENGRFRVTVDWIEPGGNSGPGRAEARTFETGTFWFFTPDNLELVIKMLDARVVDGHFWFFSGALSNVRYTITVTDTQTGAQREYLNPQGMLQSRADTGAFDG